MERKTPQRDILRQVFKMAGRPMSAHEALEAAQASLPKLGLATAYRVIKEMIDEGFLKVVTLPGDSQRFEMVRHDHHHYFQCQNCQKVYDVLGCPGNINKVVPPGFRLHSHELILYGTCQTCLFSSSC